jgi:hypothetical protein
MRETQTFQPVSYSLPGAAVATSFSETTIDCAIRAGLLPARHHGNRIVILARDLNHWLESLPSGRPSAPKQFEGKRTGRPKKVVLCTSPEGQS